MRIGTKLFGSEGDKVTTATPNKLGLAALVAVIVTGVDAAMEAGATYRPACDIVPAFAGDIDHVTAVELNPCVNAENCRICRSESVAVAGNTSIELAGAISMALMIGVSTCGVKAIVI